MMAHILLFSLLNFIKVSPLMIVAFVSIVGILIFLYFTSEVMSKKVILFITLIVVIAFLVINCFIVLKNQPLQLKFRLAFMPLQQEVQSTDQRWQGEVFWSMVAQQLQQMVGDLAAVLSSDYLDEIINVDSLKIPEYVNRFNERIKTEYYLTGEVADQQFVYQFIKNEDQSVIFGDAVILEPKKFPQLSMVICNEIMDYFEMTPLGSAHKFREVTIESYQKFITAKEHYQNARFENAIQVAGEAIAADSNLVEAYLLAGKSNFELALEKRKQGEVPVELFEKSREFFEETIRLDSTNSEAFTFLGEYYVYSERWSLAEEALSLAYQLNPNFARIYLSLSLLHDSRYRKLGFKNEEQLYKRAIFMNPCYEDAYLMLSDYYLYANNRKDAVRVLKKYLKINPNSVRSLMALGKMYLVRNEMLKIVEVFNRVLELEPDNSDAYYNLGILYYNSKDYENAENFFKRALAIDNHLNSHLYLAYIYEEQGKLEEAIKHLRYRIRYRKGRDDEFAEEARKHLYNLIHQDSTVTETQK